MNTVEIHTAAGGTIVIHDHKPGQFPVLDHMVEEWAANTESARIATQLPAAPVRKPRPQGWNDFEDVR